MIYKYVLHNDVTALYDDDKLVEVGEDRYDLVDAYERMLDVQAWYHPDGFSFYDHYDITPPASRQELVDVINVSSNNIARQKMHEAICAMRAVGVSTDYLEKQLDDLD